MKLALLAVCAALAMVVWLEMQVEAVPVEPDPAPGRSIGQENQNINLVFASLDAFNEVVERTLFEPERRPPPDTGGPQALAELRELTLTGVVIAPGTRLAVLRDHSPNEVLRVPLGASVGDWKLVEVRKDGVVLRRGSATRELLLYDKP